MTRVQKTITVDEIMYGGVQSGTGVTLDKKSLSIFKKKKVTIVQVLETRMVQNGDSIM